MTFNSLEFLIIFLPLCYAGFFLVHRGLGWGGVYGFLAVASLVFYAQFSPVLAAILAMSILFNYSMGRVIRGLSRQEWRSLTTAIAVALNLGALGYFKYVNFFVDIGNQVAGMGMGHLDVIVPIGISFYTFTQIGYLIEASAGQTKPIGLARYALFAGFFPCVTAGPLLLQKEFLSQTEGRKDAAFSPTRVAIGLTMFGMGLAKKVIIADSIAPYADVVFDGVAGGGSLGVAEAWTGALAYSLQLYFDFSGYSDMAIGIAYLFGFKLPLNFNSPFKATSIAEFWNRWHMTMTRFFTNFLYTHMAMRNARRASLLRYGRFQRWLTAGAAPVFYTFIVAGIWHGAGWTFVVFGLIHGLALAANHGWREWRMPTPHPIIGWAMTMAVVVTGLVVFRAPDLDVAGAILANMWGLGHLIDGAGHAIHVDFMRAGVFVIASGLIVLTLPNSQEILRNHWVSSDEMPENMQQMPTWIRWAPNVGWAMAVAILIVLSATSIGDGARFLYYDF